MLSSRVSLSYNNSVSIFDRRLLLRMCPLCLVAVYSITIIPVYVIMIITYTCGERALKMQTTANKTSTARAPQFAVIETGFASTGCVMRAQCLCVPLAGVLFFQCALVRAHTRGVSARARTYTSRNALARVRSLLHACPRTTGRSACAPQRRCTACWHADTQHRRTRTHTYIHGIDAFIGTVGDLMQEI